MRVLLISLLLCALLACDKPGKKMVDAPEKDWYREQFQNLPDSPLPAVFLGHTLRSVTINAANEYNFTDSLMEVFREAQPGDIIGPLVNGEYTHYYRLTSKNNSPGFMAECIYVQKTWDENDETAREAFAKLESGNRFSQVCAEFGEACTSRPQRYEDFNLSNQEELHKHKEGDVLLLDESNYYYVLKLGKLDIQVPAQIQVVCWSLRKEKPLRRINNELQDLPAEE